jgi:hypothetical protein
VSTLLAGWGVGRLRPGPEFASSFPVGETAILMALAWVASSFMLAVHAWLSLRWASFSLNVGVAIVGLFGNVIVSDSRLRDFYPWASPGAEQSIACQLVFHWPTTLTWGDALLVLAISVAGAAVVVVAGGWDLLRRDSP